MTADNYSTLTFDERASILWDRGTFLETVDYYNQAVNLYSLYSFFVEVYYNSADNQIEKLEVAGPDELKKYLGRIEIKLTKD
jgi:hypothetical protein